VNNQKVEVLLVGLNPEYKKMIQHLLEKVSVTELALDIELLMEPVKNSPSIVICGVNPEVFATNELAQTLRMHYQTTPIFVCTGVTEAFDKRIFVKNGFSDAFLLPMDEVVYKNKVTDEIVKVSSTAVKAFRSVKIIDVDPGSVLDFDTSLFLPANNKYVKLSMAGDQLDQSKIDRIKKNKINNIYVPADQMKKFYEYSAKRLKDLGKNAVSSTENRDKLSGAIRDLMSGMFNDEFHSYEDGASTLKDCGEIVKTYILEGADSEWYSRIINILGESGDKYSHSGNVSTLAALFSMGLGIGNPADLALAGLLHDLGTAELPKEIQALEPEAMTKAQFEIYQTHPFLSVNLIKKRKIVVPDSVTNAIMQHHELYNGMGYPNGFYGDKICKEAQILCLANVFDELTKLKPGQPVCTPLEAVKKLRNDHVASKIYYNPELLKKLLTLFSNPSDNPEAV
jgi:HD-GYP domain-containing protein (c-di-GMP phosphodiesterase class II)